MNHVDRRLAVAACRTIQDGDFVCMSWEFTENVPDELRELLDYYFQELIAKDWYTTVQGMIEERFNISQKEIDAFTEED